MKDIQNQIDNALDAALEMTFPASDPIALSIGDGRIRQAHAGSVTQDADIDDRHARSLIGAIGQG